MEKKELIPVKGLFPIQAKEMGLKKYQAFETLNCWEKEEAAVRLLMFSQEQGEFVSVPWSKLVNQWQEQSKEYLANDEYLKRYNQYQLDMNHYKISTENYKKEIRKNLFLNFFFAKRPQMPKFSPTGPINREFFSPTIVSNPERPDRLANAFWDLINHGLVKNEERDGIDYFSPTPRLVSIITRN